MDFGIPVGEMAMLALFLAAGGIVAGILAGLFGVGGGAIYVPVQYELLGVMGVDADARMQIAVGTSFAIIIPTAFRAAYAHYQRGAMDRDILLMLASAAMLGVFAGTLVAKTSGGDVMKIIWVVSAAILVLNLLFRPENWRIGGGKKRPLALVPLGAIVGFLSTMMGIGGGAFVTPLLVLFGIPIHRAVGTASGYSCFLAIPALIGFIWAGWGEVNLPPGSLGYVSLIGAAAMIPTSVLAAPLGVRMAHGLSRRMLELIFASYLAMVGIRFLVALYV